MKPDLKLGRELAEKVPLEKWFKERQCIVSKPHDKTWDENIAALFYGSGSAAKADAIGDHIAHHSGQTMIQIYDYINDLDSRNIELGRQALDLISENGELQTKISSLEAQIKKENETVLFHFKQQRNLEAKNKVMEEALKKISKNFPNPNICSEAIADEALSRVKKMRKEK